jgi:uncharacterized protein YndB with AHSA1/START domain
MPDSDAPPITHSLTLACSAEHAFATYTERISTWWDPCYTANPATLESVTIEPQVGGRVFATHRDIGRHDWGEVITYEPGRRLVHTFTLAQDPAHPSEVAIDFEPAATGDGCTIRLAHGGWNAANASARQKFGDWPLILARFAALANPDA